MKKISDIDKRFNVEHNIKKDDIKFYNVLQFPFKVYGVFYENSKFRRMPEDIAKTVSEAVYCLHANTAGGRVRFKTDSPYIAIWAKMSGLGKMPHFTFAGSIGFDLYIKNENGEFYNNTFVPPMDITDGYESIVEFEKSEMREITVNFPLYSEVCELYVGISEKSFIGEAEKYKTEKPIVFYGSSITQGGCASRPGNSYQSMISRRFDCDYINLGFSGGAKAEDEIADYIKKLDMSLFVYDYDYNAPTVQHLMNTHDKMFRAIRKENPDLPIIIMSAPNFFLSKEGKERLDIIKATYDNAVSGGDKNVYFISGQKLMEITGNDGTVDGIHPNDFGFISMARILGDVIEKIGCI